MWTRRLTRIGGTTEPNDWVVLRDRVPVGRVYYAVNSSGHKWRWVCWQPVGEGLAETMGSALEAVRARAMIG